jgi:hypothetical protein
MPWNSVEVVVTKIKQGQQQTKTKTKTKTSLEQLNMASKWEMKNLYDAHPKIWDVNLCLHLAAEKKKKKKRKDVKEVGR